MTPYLKVLEPFVSSSECKLYMSYPASGQGCIVSGGGFLLRTKVVSFARTPRPIIKFIGYNVANLILQPIPKKNKHVGMILPHPLSK